MRAADDYDAIAERQRRLAVEQPDPKSASSLAVLQRALARRRAIEIERRRIFGHPAQKDH
jgi:hypothetical protein